MICHKEEDMEDRQEEKESADHRLLIMSIHMLRRHLLSF